MTYHIYYTHIKIDKNINKPIYLPAYIVTYLEIYIDWQPNCTIADFFNIPFQQTRIAEFAVSSIKRNIIQITILKIPRQDFPGGAVDKNLPTNAGTQVHSLVQEDSTCHRTNKLMCHDYWTHAPRVSASQEKPPQWGLHALQRRPRATTNKNNKEINIYIFKN